MIAYDPYILNYPSVPISHTLNGVIKNSSAITLFAGHDLYGKLILREIKILIGFNLPAITDGRTIIDLDKSISDGFIYNRVSRRDMNEHTLVNV